MAEVNEKSSSWITVTCTDKNGVAATPLTLTYRIDDLKSGESIVPTTSITPGSAVEIAITPDQNRILDVAAVREIRRITVIATYGLSDQTVQEFDYDVVNMSFAS